MSQPNTVMIIIAPAHDHTKHRVATLQSWSNSVTFPDILKEHKWSIAPRNSSDMMPIGNNVNYFPEN